MKVICNYGFLCQFGEKGDRLWWVTDDHGIRSTYILSAHTVRHPQYSNIWAFHLVIGPMRLLVAKRHE